jgi:hypothetical protein
MTMRHYIRSFVHALELRSVGSLYINSTFLPISKVLHPLYIGDLRRDGKEGQALVS